MPGDYLQRLTQWDQYPESMPLSLQQPASPRLGLYFEQLYAAVLTELLGWTLIARNVQIRDQQRTLGELDFLVLNPHTNEVEHHEIAIKFYLGHVGEETGSARWYGPNSRDRLDLKTSRLLQHQAQLAAQPAAEPVLKSMGLQRPPVPRIFMPGYLFYPDTETLQTPEQVDPGHERGRWRYASQAALSSGDDWVVLQKPHWLACWRQSEVPPEDGLQQAAMGVIQSGRACLLAHLSQTPCGWVETERMFLVPDSWPGVPSSG
ncbi:DUF1853 family protein [Marinobacterium sediminicola]